MPVRARMEVPPLTGVCHPAWENVFIVVCPAFCVWPPARREREREGGRLEGVNGDRRGEGVGAGVVGQRIARG